MKINRRSLIGSGLFVGATASAACSTHEGASRSHDDPFSPQSLQADLEAYDGFGVHRPGGAGDLATADGLEDGFFASGFETQPMAFEVPDHDRLDAQLVGGEHPILPEIDTMAAHCEA